MKKYVYTFCSPSFLLYADQFVLKYNLIRQNCGCFYYTLSCGTWKSAAAMNTALRADDQNFKKISMAPQYSHTFEIHKSSSLLSGLCI